MIIDINAVNGDTRKQYELLQKQVEDLIQKYQQEDGERFSSIMQKIEQTNGDWDKCITLIDGDKTTDIPILQVIAYEYCLATERITEGRIPFNPKLDDDVSNRLFSRLAKFRIGNPIPGKDVACLYGKSNDDETGVPITSKLYRLFSTSGAQHIGYFEGGEKKGAIFLLEQEEVPEFAKDEHGNDISYNVAGVPFKNLPTFMTLLTYFRQTAFHEWNHEMEKDYFEGREPSIEQDYESVDGKKYKNYEKIEKYYTSEYLAEYKEPQYIISTEKDEKGKPKKYYIDSSLKKPDTQSWEDFVKQNGRPLKEARFPLKPISIEEQPILVSSGMSTIEITENGEEIIHNQVTEGFVEATARAMVYAIAPDTIDLDEGRYFEKVEMARQVIRSRDTMLGQHRTNICRFSNTIFCIKRRIRSPKGN